VTFWQEIENRSWVKHTVRSAEWHENAARWSSTRWTVSHALFAKNGRKVTYIYTVLRGSFHHRTVSYLYLLGMKWWMTHSMMIMNDDSEGIDIEIDINFNNKVLGLYMSPYISFKTLNSQFCWSKHSFFFTS